MRAPLSTPISVAPNPIASPTCNFLPFLVSASGSKAGKVDLDDPATTLALLKLNSLVSLPSSAGSERFSDHGFQHLLIYISKLLDIEAAFAGTVLAELGQ